MNEIVKALMWFAYAYEGHVENFVGSWDDRLYAFANFVFTMVAQG